MWIPIDLDLYFERFINEHRSNAPDFDIDFSWTDRDDVTRYILTASVISTYGAIGLLHLSARCRNRELGSIRPAAGRYEI